VLNIPFCFIDEDLMKSCNIDKNKVDYAMILDPNSPFSTKVTPFNSCEAVKPQNFNHLDDYSFVKNDVFSGID